MDTLPETYIANDNDGWKPSIVRGYVSFRRVDK